MFLKIFKICSITLCLGWLLNVSFVDADVATKAQLFFSTHTATFTEGATFEVPIFLNTHGGSINTVELHIKFDPHKLAIIKPSSDTSLIALWLEPPTYSNILGTAKILGSIPNGITTDNGIVTTITFKAIESGSAPISIAAGSQVLANDGKGTDVLADFDRASFTIIPQQTSGPKVFSETHQFDDHWYNNNSPTFAWYNDDNATGFSFLINNEPFTIPDNTVDSTSTITSFENLHDGVWYFHIKAQKKNVWGGTTHFMVRIDTEPPAPFTPTQGVLSASVVNPTLISYSTTDALSGIDHYEIGVTNKAVADQSPLFVPAESPYQVPLKLVGDFSVIVRAFDRAGNVRNATLDIHINGSFIKKVVDIFNRHTALFFFGLLGIMILIALFHFLFGHHIIRRFKHVLELMRKEQDPPPPPPPASPPPPAMPTPHYNIE